MILYLVNRMSTGLLIGTPRDPGEIFIPLLGGYIFDERCSGVWMGLSFSSSFTLLSCAQSSAPASLEDLNGIWEFVNSRIKNQRAEI